MQWFGIQQVFETNFLFFNCFDATFSLLGNGDIAYCDVQGELGMITVANVTNNVVVQRNAAVVQEESLDLDLPNELFHESVNNDDDDDDGENVISLEKLKRETLGLEENESEARSGK